MTEPTKIKNLSIIFKGDVTIEGQPSPVPAELHIRLSHISMAVKANDGSAYWLLLTNGREIKVNKVQYDTVRLHLEGE